MARFALHDLRNRFRRPFSTEQVATAVHEAAHAVVAMACDARVTRVFIEQKPDELYGWTGRCEYTCYATENAGIAAVNSALITVAPMAAMGFMDGPIRAEEADWWNLSGGDLRKMQKHHDAFADVYPDYHEFQQRFCSTARDILERHQTAFERIAWALMLTGEADEELLRCLPGGLAARWEQYDDDHEEEAARSAAEPIRYAARPQAPTYRVGSQKVTTRDLIPGLRYSDAVPMESRGGR